MGAPAVGPKLTDRQRLHWLRLIRTENVGPASFRSLINRYGSAEAALEALPELVTNGGSRSSPRIPSLADTEKEIAAAQRSGAIFAAVGEPEYPSMLRNMDTPPPILAIRGRPDMFLPPAVAIVGARNASISAQQIARLMAAELGRSGYAVVSGLARGIDTAAHTASLPTGTIAVLAGGLDQPYPPENARLCDEIANGGVLISEMPFGWQPRARDFPRRNRLVAGLALGLVVVEAAQRSGSLISARLANEMGRLVFAVPGSPMDPRAAGTNQLLKEGAIIATEASDVLSALAPLTDLAQSSPGQPAEDQIEYTFAPGSPGDAERARLIEALGPAPIHIDEIIRHTGIHAAQVSTILLELDLAGRLERHAGGSVSLLLYP